MTSPIAGSLDMSLKITTSVLISVALLFSVFRMALRVWARTFWWDDVCAGIALTCTIICLVTDWIRLLEGGSSSVIAFWLYALASSCVVWSARLSILSFASRVVYPSQVSRGAMLSVAPLFTLTWISLEGMSAYRYSSDHSWYTDPDPDSNVEDNLTRPMALCELVADVISGSILIFLPRYWLRRVKLSQKQRRLTVLASNSSIIITSVSLGRAILQVIPVISLVSTATNIDIAASLFMCSLLVIMDRFCRFINHNAGAPDVDNPCSDGAESIGMTQNSLPLTSVDLESLRSRASGADNEICVVSSALVLEGDEGEPDRLIGTDSIEDTGKISSL
ncbi:hypothetical protein F5I97DRAFT_1924488 [Phlebopus sp. FC_14]|nr:hypothetical protein F5I97DRAFT_1924488 [Phlebopus sp. FC_14]